MYPSFLPYRGHVATPRHNGRENRTRQMSHFVLNDFYFLYNSFSDPQQARETHLQQTENWFRTRPLA